MTIDTSDDAVKNDLRLAESSTSDRVSRIALKRAEIRVQLRAFEALPPTEYVAEVQPQHDPTIGAPPAPGAVDINVIEWEHGKTYVVPEHASVEDLIEVASMLLGLDAADLDAALKPIDDKIIAEATQHDDGDEDLWAQAEAERRA